MKSLNGVQISIDRIMTKYDEHRVVYAVSRVANCGQWSSLIAVSVPGNQRPTGIGNVEMPQLVQYHTVSNSAVDIDVTLESHNMFISATTGCLQSQPVNELEFNVPFQHKYGYIRDEQSQPNRFTGDFRRFLGDIFTKL